MCRTSTPKCLDANAERACVETDGVQVKNAMLCGKCSAMRGARERDREEKKPREEIERNRQRYGEKMLQQERRDGA